MRWKFNKFDLRNEKVVSYVTDGQIVPHNISVAEPLTFIRRINGYRISDDAEFIKKIKSKSYY